MPSKTLRSEKLDLRLTRKGNARMPHCARNSYKISKVAALRRARISLLRALQCHTDCSYVEKHSLGTALGGTLQGDETIARIPIDPVPICIRNDAAASHSVCNSKCDFEGFGNESMPKTLS